MADYNSMQANLGLVSGLGAPSGVQSPAAVAAQLSQQASMQMQHASNMLPIVSSSAASFTFGQQFQQNFQNIQSQQAFNPYQASALSSLVMPSVLPSPLLMTPASSGVFRPHMQPGGGMSPMSPMPVMPQMMTPFTPRLPAPMFQTAWEQELQQRELRSDQIYSMMAQTPRFGGAMMGIGMGAMAGAAAGQRMGLGRVGMAGGALLGAAAAGVSGFAGAMGDMGMIPMRPSMDAHQMGLSIQQSSRDWVVGGAQLHPYGMGFSREASMQLARNVQDLAGDSGFKRETGGMFNRNDLMGIMRTSGRVGLMDMEQSVDGVGKNLREVSRVVKKFMELTNDPDVVNVVKQMGQLRTFGLSVPEMETAAQNMRMYSRMAGTSIAGIQQNGGLPGAMTFQQAGLTAGAGFNYGMYSLASARQAVASGTFSESQLALLGGVSGVSQRNTQAQAALMSMPMMGAAFASYGSGGSWGTNAHNVAGMAQSANPINMVMGAYQNLSQGVLQGGVGALAMFPLQQRQINDQVARQMSPAEQTVMRYRMALNTGKSMGLQGSGAFAAGARMLYGDEMAEQMVMEASNPDYWRSQQDGIQRRKDELARQQLADIMATRPGIMSSISASISGSRFGRAVSDVSSGVGGAIASPFRAAGRALDEWDMQDRERDALESGQTLRLGRATGNANLSSKRLKNQFYANVSTSFAHNVSSGGGAAEPSNEEFARLYSTYITRDSSNETLATVLGMGSSRLTRAMRSFDAWGYEQDLGGHAAALKAVAQARGEARNVGELVGAGLGAARTGQQADANYALIEKEFGLQKGTGFLAAGRAGTFLANIAKSKVNLIGKDDPLSAGDLDQAGIMLLQDRGMSEKQARAAFASASAAGRKALITQATQAAYTIGNSDVKAVIQKTNADATLTAHNALWDQTDKDLDALKSRKAALESTWTSEFGFQDKNNSAAAKALMSASPEEVLAMGISFGGLGSKEQDKMSALLRSQLATKNPKATAEQLTSMTNTLLADVEGRKLGGQKGAISDSAVEWIRNRGKGASGAKLLGTLQTYQDVNVRESGLEFLTAGMETVGAGGMTFEQLLSSDKTPTNMNKKHLGMLAQIRGAKDKNAPEIQKLRQDMLEDLTETGAKHLGRAQELTQATGEEARKLNKEGAAVAGAGDEFSEAFKFFNKETTSNFAEGAKLLYDAMLTNKVFG